MSRHAKCEKCLERPWTRIVAGRGLCDPCLDRRKSRKRGGKDRRKVLDSSLES